MRQAIGSASEVATIKPPIIRRRAFALCVRQREVHLRLASTDRVGERAPRSARHRPAERAVSGVEPQVAITRGADQWHVRRRRRTQSRPEGGAGGIAGVGKEIERAALECCLLYTSP